MASYTGLLRIPNTRDAVDALFEINDNNLRVTAGDDVLGDWPLADVSVEDRGDALLVSLSGEPVLVDIGDRDGFSAALAPVQVKRRRRSRNRRPMKEPGPARRQDPPPPAQVVASQPVVQVAAKPDRVRASSGSSFAEKLEYVGAVFRVDNWREWLQDRTVRWAIASMGVILFAMMALFATSTLGMVLVLVGMVALIVAALAVSEDLNAYRLVPNAVSETGLVVIGAVAMVLGGILIVLG